MLILLVSQSFASLNQQNNLVQMSGDATIVRLSMNSF